MTYEKANFTPKLKLKVSLQTYIGHNISEANFQRKRSESLQKNVYGQYSNFKPLIPVSQIENMIVFTATIILQPENISSSSKPIPGTARNYINHYNQKT